MIANLISKVVLTMHLCMVDAPNECRDYHFAPPFELTIEQCTMVAPVVVPQLLAQINDPEEIVVLKSFRCQNLQEQKI